MIDLLLNGPSLAKAIRQPIVQSGHAPDLLLGLPEGVIDAMVTESFSIEPQVAGPAVSVARLADRADVDDPLLVPWLEHVVDVFLGLKGWLRREDSRNVGVTYEADRLDHFEQIVELRGTGPLRVPRQDVLRGRIPRRAMDEQPAPPVDLERPILEEVPTRAARRAQHAGAQLLLGPFDRGTRHLVEAPRALENCLVVVSHQRGLAAFPHEVRTPHGIGTVSDHVSETIDLLVAHCADVLENRGQRFQIAMNVGYERCAFHDRS